MVSWVIKILLIEMIIHDENNDIKSTSQMRHWSKAKFSEFACVCVSMWFEPIYKNIE